MTETADSPTPVEDLLARARAYVTHSHAKNTLDAYAADWEHFGAWCDDHKRRALPASRFPLLTIVVAERTPDGSCRSKAAQNVVRYWYHIHRP